MGKRSVGVWGKKNYKKSDLAINLTQSKPAGSRARKAQEKDWMIHASAFPFHAKSGYVACIWNTTRKRRSCAHKETRAHISRMTIRAGHPFHSIDYRNVVFEISWSVVTTQRLERSSESQKHSCTPQHRNHCKNNIQFMIKLVLLKSTHNR